MKNKAGNKKEERVQTHSKPSQRKQILLSLGVFSIILVATIFAVLYGRGYRFALGGGTPTVSKTGILNVSSTPESAQVYVNDHLTTATDNSVNLAPGKYTIKVSKDGYNDWQKDVDIHPELVTNIDALLFPTSPTLQSISTFGVESAVLDPSGTKLAVKIASQSATKNGIYIFDMTARIIPVLAAQSSSTQLADDTLDNFSQAQITWSPDGKQLLASISTVPDPTTGETGPENTGPVLPQPESESLAAESTVGTSTYYLLDGDGFNETPQNITATYPSVMELWETQRLDKERARLRSLKPKVAQFSKQYFNILSWSPDDKKILYQASESAEMPVFLSPRRIGNNWRYERRDLEKGAIYVYNIVEDVNTRIVGKAENICEDTDPDCINDNANSQTNSVPPDNSDFKTPFSWFPDSEHLIYVNDRKINVVETDGANMTTIYAGPFVDSFVFPWPDGSKIVIITSLGNSNVSPTLYTIGLK